jgi:hypothetical protein
MNIAFRKPSPKSQILDESGYVYNFDRRLYVSRREKKAFSLPFLESHSEAEIEQCIKSAQGGANGGGWHFFFNEPPSNSVTKQLVNLLE